MAEELKRLVAARGQCKGFMTRLKTYISNLEPDSTDKEVVQSVEDAYFEMAAFLTEKLSPTSACAAATTPAAQAPAAPTGFQRLPRIEITKFSGEVGDYHDFISLYNSVIKKDSTLSSCDKFYYLRSLLEGEALNIIKHLPLDNDNYEAALQLLSERYDNKQQVINYHITSILDLPSVQKTSASAIRNLVYKTKQHLSALKNMNVPVEQWDLVILTVLQRKLDQYTLRAFHLEKQGLDLPTLHDLFTFLEQRATALDTLGQSGPGVRRSSLIASTTSSPTKQSPIKCKYCGSRVHKLYQCPSFKLLENAQRQDYVKSNNLCKICLNEHNAKKCHYGFKCSVCKEKHNSLLNEDSVPSQSSGHVSLLSKVSDNVLLPTVKVKLMNKHGNPVYVRAILDSGSQVSFVQSDLVKELGCSLQHSDTIISGVCDGSSRTTQQATISMHSTADDFNMSVTCHVVDNITCKMPQFTINKEEISLPSYVRLADEDFHICDKISILLGCDIFFQVLLREQLPVQPGELYLHNTRFGYIVAGRVSSSTRHTASHLTSAVCCAAPVRNSLANLEKNMSQFWQTEKVPEIYIEATTEQELAENIFKESVVLQDSKFQVNLPLKQDIKSLKLGDSLTCALKRFKNLEMRLNKDPVLYNKYKAFIEEYITLGHAIRIPISDYDLDEQAAFFLPHHPVFNEKSATTKLRVVFDASMQSLNKVSLNDVLLNGPVVQNDLFNILILFRLFKFVINCDIQKMFRQILVAPSHRCLQNILWRPSPNDEIQCLQLQTVTYGLKSSSFLATRCLLELANRYKDDFPLAADVLLHNTYVDDANIACNDKELLLQTRDELIELLKRGGFSLHKWCTNDESLLGDIPSYCKKEGNEVHFTDKNDSAYVRTLGVKCNLVEDTLIISAPRQDILECYTKRKVLSFISKIFDPLGLAGPIVVIAKLLMQKIWLANVSWDSVLPAKLNEESRTFAASLDKMTDIKVTRNIDTRNARSIDIVGYADASSHAYGCCIYLRVVSNGGGVTVQLLCSKSRVNPVQKLTTPRLELNSALLLAILASKIYDIMKLKFKPNVYLYADSQVVLAWLKTDPMKLSMYVANRVKSIHDLTRDFSWHYINTAINPADCLSRGVEPHLLQSHLLWWKGPACLSSPEFQPARDDTVMPKEIPELKKSLVVTRQNDLALFTDCSSITKMKRIIAWCYRFIQNCQKCLAGKKTEKKIGHLTPRDLDHSLNVIIRYEQAKHFSEEIKALSSSKPIKSNLQELHPFLCSMSLLRIGGRLQHANVPFSQKHPIILPKGTKVTRYLIENEHRTLLHAGPKLVLNNLSHKYRIIGGIREVTRVLYKCIVCFKLKAKHAEQLMGSLPRDRVNTCRVFDKVGLDYGGPLTIKMYRVRKPILYKAYIALFVCFATKAVHIELVSDLTTESFLNAFKRFISRRNKPSVVYCDNASTFKGADNQLHELYRLHSAAVHQQTVANHAAELGIEFKYIPSYSPVFGSLWEAGIKSIKHHLKRVVGTTVLTYEELNTVIIQIEGILNSRPLTALPTTDFTEMPYLTPGHFLTGAPLTSYPEHDCTNIPTSRLKFWQQCTQMVQNFWKQWNKQYLVQLQNRPKWRTERDNIKVGTLVIVRDDNVTPLKWPMARVVEVFPGPDGKVRALSIRTSKGSIVRTSIYKICVLPIED